MSSEVKLSIIMPCYNGAKTIGRALDSVFMQKADFNYEVIIVDDGSTDNSAEIMEKYQSEHKNIRIIGDGTNYGNAMAFYRGLSASSGKYFCVLDVDDYYTINSKLQKQIDFLDKDVNEDYVAVTHHYIIDLGGGRVNLPDCSGIEEFNYMDLINQRSGYYHTATYVYRNIFRGRVPSLFKEDRFRGDTVRTVIHLMYSNKKVKVLNIVGSAYCWSNTGIWSSMNQKDQFDRQIGIWAGLKEISSTDIEKNAFEKLINQCAVKKEKVAEEQRRYPSVSADYLLKTLKKYASKYAFSNRDFVFRAIYYSEYLDTAASSIGFVYRQNKNNLIQTHAEKDTVCLMATSLKPHGGGIFREITEIVQMYPDKNFYIISTESAESDKEAFKILEKYEKLKVITVPKNCSDKLQFLSETYVNISPEKTYYYDPHDDFFPSAIMQTGFSKNVCLFSYDHGFVCNLSSPNIDCIISKRPVDYKMLNQAFGKKVIYVPAWNDYHQYLDNFQYKPFDGHDKIITACGAARFYKLDSKTEVSYIDLVLNLLKKTGGQHFHFGPIPDEKLEYIRTFIRENGMKDDSFVYVPWADDPLKFVIDNKVDLFIEPFPIVSYKITLDVLMGGIPVIAYDGNTRMSTTDFIYPECIKWRNPADFIQTIESLDADTLLAHSEKSIEYFEKNHKKDTIKDYFRNEVCFTPIRDIEIVDGKIHDVMEHRILFSNGHIKNARMINSTAASSINPNIIRDASLKLRLKLLLNDLKLLFIKYTSKPSPDFNSKAISELLKSQNVTDHRVAYEVCLKHSKDINAVAWLARMYRDGKGTKKNPDKAIKLMREASEKNVSWAKLELIDMLLARGNDADKTEAFRLCSELAATGNPGACGRQGRMYRDGVGTDKNEKLAIEWMRKASDDDIGWAKLELTDMLLARGNDADKTEAFRLCNELASKGRKNVFIPLAHMYRDGIGTEKDLDLSIEWLRKAVEKKISDSEKELAQTLIMRKTGDDVSEAITLYENIAESGNSEAYMIISKMYADGTYVEKDLDKAIHYARMARELIERGEIMTKKNNVKSGASVNNLVDMLLKKGGEKDRKEAFDICKKSAELGDYGSIGRLGRMYRDGIGTEKNQALAIECLGRAANRGIPWADREYVNLLLLRNTEEDQKNAFGIVAYKSLMGDVNSLEILSKMYSEGLFLFKNEKYAADIMVLAYEKGSKNVRMNFVDTVYRNNLSEHYAKAFEICKQLAEENDIGGYGRLARMYHDGKGTEVNLDLAAEWMNKALENNVGWAKLELLDILIARSGKDDKKRARKLCEELVEENNAGGYGRLARMYRDGWGVDVDLERAKSLMKKAADMGVKWAITEYSEMIEK